MLTGITDLLRGHTGSFEINRVVGAFGALFYIVGTHVFVGYEVFYLGKDFDLVNYCVFFPGGLAALGLGTAGAVAIKDRNVATAKVVSETGSQPATPPQPAPTVQPELLGDTKLVTEEANL